MILRDLPAKTGLIISVGIGIGRSAAHPYSHFRKGMRHTGGFRMDIRYRNCQKHKSWA